MTGNTNTAETATLTGLTPNTTYFFNIKATNSVGTSLWHADQLRDHLAPLATTSAASGTTATTSTLNGSVNAENALDHGHLLLQHLTTFTTARGPPPP